MRHISCLYLPSSSVFVEYPSLPSYARLTPYLRNGLKELENSFFLPSLPMFRKAGTASFPLSFPSRVFITHVIFSVLRGCDSVPVNRDFYSLVIHSWRSHGSVITFSSDRCPFLFPSSPSSQGRNLVLVCRRLIPMFTSFSPAPCSASYFLFFSSNLILRVCRNQLPTDFCVPSYSSLTRGSQLGRRAVDFFFGKLVPFPTFVAPLTGSLLA